MVHLKGQNEHIVNPEEMNYSMFILFSAKWCLFELDTFKATKSRHLLILRHMYASVLWNFVQTILDITVDL